MRSSLTYQKYLSQKLQDEHQMLHMVQAELKVYHDKNQTLLKQIEKLRRIQNDFKEKIKRCETINMNLQKEITVLKQRKQNKKQSVPRVGRKEVQPQKINSKLVFQQCMEQTYPKNKETVKRLLKFFLYLQQHEDKSPLERFQAYKFFIGSCVKRLLNWIFPNKKEPEKPENIAENMVKQWKSNSAFEKSTLEQLNGLKLKEIKYLARIKQLQLEFSLCKAKLTEFQKRFQSYDRCLKIKSGEFVSNFKRMMSKEEEKSKECKKSIEDTLQIFTSFMSQKHVLPKKELSPVSKLVSVAPRIESQQYPSKEAKRCRKTVSVIKKNIYGYYE